jgi:hypothetical protein
MPGYGIAAAADGVLPWSWAAERLAKSRNYYVVTTRPDGRPHAMPVWGVLIDELLCFSTSTTSTKARNLARDARCTVATERADEAVIVEGTAEALAGEALLARFKAVYKEKYDWDVDTAQGGLYAVRPVKVFGFIEHSDQFTSTATRWTFEKEA